jgi:thioredoxin reductase (NADPH)
VDTALTGGQVKTTHMVSNYPGFKDPQPGFMLMHYMQEQAVAAGVEFRQAVDVTTINLQKKEILIDDYETIHAKKIIIATGSSPKPLGLPGEKEYRGKGISYCATCDAKYYEGKEIILIGGGNSAIEEALFISRFTSKITIVHQFDVLQANKVAQEKIFANKKVSFLFEHEPRAFIKRDNGDMAVVVENIGEAIHWYRNHFACNVLHQDQSWAMLHFGNVQLALVLPEKDPAHGGFVTRQVSDSSPFLTTGGNGIQFPYVEEVELGEAA